MAEGSRAHIKFLIKICNQILKLRKIFILVRIAQYVFKLVKIEISSSI